MRWVGALLLAAGCSSRSVLAPVGTADTIIPPTRGVHAVLINGGGRPEINYQSHLQHVKDMVKLLESDGVPPEDIAIFSGSGSDAAPDLATRERVAETDSWLIPDNVALRPAIVYANSAVEGMTLHPARKDALRAWFQNRGSRLRRGDTLLFYVTDHGRRNDQDLSNNEIVLWGENLGVAELHEFFAFLDPHVRVVMLMSQCYAGSFANEIFKTPADTLPVGNVCGYFASTADRRAYGCYPENLGKEGIGHSVTFIQALALLGRLPEANRRVLVTDSTPDVPHTSSDFFLDRLLREKAQEAGEDPDRYIDDRLLEAWTARAVWEADLRLLDRIGLAFGSLSARSVAELKERSHILLELNKQLDLYAHRWKHVLESLREENLKLFVDAHPEWRPRLEPAAVNSLDADARRATLAELLRELVPFTKGDANRHRRLLTLREKADDAAAAAYRVEVRLGAALRMRSLLTSIAGRHYLATRATAAERQAYDRLQSCEDLSISNTPAVALAADLDAPTPFPPLAEEQRTLEAVMPAWIGITYGPLNEAAQKRHDTKPGAVETRSILPGSPAATAGLLVGDILVGPPDHPFTEPNQVREWTMRSEIGKPQPLAILRGDTPMLITLRPEPYPVELPKPPAP